VSELGKCRKGHQRTSDTVRAILKNQRVYLECVPCGEARRERHNSARRIGGPRDLTKCKNGHEYVAGSYSVYPEGNGVVRRCKKCWAMRSREYRDRKKYAYLLTPR